MWRRRLGNKLSNTTKQELKQAHPFFMRPLVFLSGWMVLALLFGFQEFAEISVGGWKIPLWIPLLGWTVEFLLWGLIFLGMWQFLRESIQSASPRQLLLQYLPLSVALSIIKEVLVVTIFRYQSPGMHFTYLERLERYLASELITNIAIFWIVIALFRSIGYYQRFRERLRGCRRSW
jgi:two-component system, LytTR family, sensor kinase